MGTWRGKRLVIGVLSTLMIVIAGAPAAVVAVGGCSVRANCASRCWR